MKEIVFFIELLLAMKNGYILSPKGENNRSLHLTKQQLVAHLARVQSSLGRLQNQLTLPGLARVDDVSQ